MDPAGSIHSELPTALANDRPKPEPKPEPEPDLLLVDQQPQLDSDAVRATHIHTRDTVDSLDATQEPKRRPTKRKHSPAILSAPTPPTTTPSSHAASPAPNTNTTTTAVTGGDPSDISHPPVLVPHTLHLPESEFDFYSTRSHPFNKHGYRYTPCGPSLGTPLPVPPQRTIESFPKGVHWSWQDRSQFTVLTEDARTITTDKGWRAARANVGVREGAWYWEIKIERGGGDGGRDKGGEGQGSWVRPGVGRRESPLNAPVGIDGYSYGYRDKTGDAVSLAQPTPFGRPYGTSAVIGVYVSLPPRPPLDPFDRRSPARIVRKRIPIRYRGSLYFEQLEYAPSKEMDKLLVDPALEAFRKRQQEEKLAKAKATAPGTKAPPSTEESGPPLRPLPKLEGSQVAFFLDGECQGVAFEDLYDFLPLRKLKNPNGSNRERSKKDSRALMENWHDDGAAGYFPMVSVFGGGIATLNPGPDFDFPPPSGDLDPVLAKSPHPPTKPRVKMPAGDDDDKVGHWRPLCERYDEFVEEQAYLDDLDAQEAVRVLLEAKQDALRGATAAVTGASRGTSSGGGGVDGALTATTASGTATPTKKARIATTGGTGAEASTSASASLAQATASVAVTASAAAAAAAAASNRLAALGVVEAESAAAAQTESPAQSPSPLPPPPPPTTAALPSFSH